MNSVIDQFLTSYRREFDFYEESARICAQLCEVELRGMGKRVIVTYRAKSPDRLNEKLHRREQEEAKSYATTQDILEDIIDFSGVRIALYFPGDQQEIDKVIKHLFRALRPPKTFPDGRRKKYEKQFDGYHAIHYLVGLKPDKLGHDQQRYVDARIEIQVASVLMHAWAEVEHDLVYKPLSGDLSDGEHAILDEINGLVLTGEIALRRLQAAFDERVNQANQLFTNHYELAAFLYRELRLTHEDGDEPGIGRVDLLFQLLRHYQKNQPAVLKPLLSAVITDPDHARPIAEQIVDLFIGSNKERYQVFESIRAMDTRGLAYGAESNDRAEQAIGKFLTAWIGLERTIRQRTGVKQTTWWHALRGQHGLSGGLIEELDSLRRIRNQLVHGIEAPSPDLLAIAIDRIRKVTNELVALMPVDEKKRPRSGRRPT
jgi:ppGpp synthetase/RelA/SpoT-type nucleotidyltranferase